MKQLPSAYGPSSHAIHAGEAENDGAHAHVGPIYQSSTFGFDTAQEGARQFTGEEKGYIYSRWYNPTVEVLENKVAALEARDLRRIAGDAEPVEVSALAFSSGMAAISSVLYALLRPGDRVITHGGLYGGTTELFQNFLPEIRVATSWVSMNAADQLEADIARAERSASTEGKPALVYIETPANPALHLCDIAMVTEVAHAHGLKVVADNTFATPVLQQPLALGVDFVVHSTTKYLNGHGTTVGGIVVSTHTEFLSDELWEHRKLRGGSASPFDAWLVNLGIKTLALRMERHCANALTVARWLSDRSDVSAVHYPGLEDDPYHALARKQMQGFGGMIAFELTGGLSAGVAMMNAVKLCSLAVSLGTVDTLISHPASMTHSMVPVEDRIAAGITDGLVRLSVGLEDVDDILDDLDRALDKPSG